jgi:hypothetical protein
MEYVIFMPIELKKLYKIVKLSLYNADKRLECQILQKSSDYRLTDF